MGEYPSSLTILYFPKPFTRRPSAKHHLPFKSYSERPYYYPNEELTPFPCWPPLDKGPFAIYDGYGCPAYLSLRSSKVRFRPKSRLFNYTRSLHPVLRTASKPQPSRHPNMGVKGAAHPSATRFPPRRSCTPHRSARLLCHERARRQEKPSSQGRPRQRAYADCGVMFFGSVILI